jgi:hypothetical protein
MITMKKSKAHGEEKKSKAPDNRLYLIVKFTKTHKSNLPKLSPELTASRGTQLEKGMIHRSTNQTNKHGIRNGFKGSPCVFSNMPLF